MGVQSRIFLWPDQGPWRSAGQEEGSRFPRAGVGERRAAFGTEASAVVSGKLDFNMPSTQPPELDGPNARTTETQQEGVWPMPSHSPSGLSRP